MYRDGFVIVRDTVPRDLTFNARRAINMRAAKEGIRRPYHDLSGTSTLRDLVNSSPLGEIMRDAMGPYDPPQSAFAAILYPQAKTQAPNYGWHPHVDGMWYSPDIPKTRDNVGSWVPPGIPHYGNLPTGRRRLERRERSAKPSLGARPRSKASPTRPRPC